MIQLRASNIYFAIAVAVALGGVATTANAACMLAGGEATMATEGLARFMANAALKNSIAGKGAKPQGAIKVVCTPSLLTHCIARQKACK